MKDFLVLKFLDKFKGVFEKVGIEYELMRNILQVKLIMDGRRVPTIISNSSKEKKEDNDENNFKKSLWYYVFIGVFIIPFILMGNNFIFQMSLTFGLLMFMLMTSLISDFSSVLLDVRDKNIIFSKPVKSITISAAKLIHILIYMFMITISLTGPALITALIKNGVMFFLLFLFEIILMDLFIVVLTALLYMLILRFFDGEKLKDIINYVQIALSIAMAIGYQMLGRVFNFINLDVVFKPSWWQYIMAPIWFGAPFELFLKGSQDVHYKIFSSLVLLIPLISIALYIKLVPSFERNIQKLNDNSSKGKKEHNRIPDLLSNVICSSGEERTFFKFTLYMLKNERQFKLRVYPSLGLALIFPFIFLFNRLSNEKLVDIASGKSYLNIYFCAILIPILVMNMKYSETYKGRWIYNALPLKDTAPIFKGTLKAFVIRLLLPIYIAEGIIFTIIFGVRIIPDLILVLLIMLLFTVVCFIAVRKALPFSKPLEAGEKNNGIITIPLMLFLGFLAAVHYACTLVNSGIYICMIVMLIINIFLWKKSFNLTWEKVNNE